MNDKKLLKWLLLLLLLLPLTLAIFGGDRFRYPCQDPDNWDKPECQKPLCEITKQCPENLLKNGRELSVGSSNGNIQSNITGVNCK
jgi:hypothetical protein